MKQPDFYASFLTGRFCGETDREVFCLSKGDNCFVCKADKLESEAQNLIKFLRENQTSSQ